MRMMIIGNSAAIRRDQPLHCLWKPFAAGRSWGEPLKFATRANACADRRRTSTPSRAGAFVWRTAGLHRRQSCGPTRAANAPPAPEPLSAPGGRPPERHCARSPRGASPVSISGPECAIGVYPLGPVRTIYGRRMRGHHDRTEPVDSLHCPRGPVLPRQHRTEVDDFCVAAARRPTPRRHRRRVVRDAEEGGLPAHAPDACEPRPRARPVRIRPRTPTTRSRPKTRSLHPETVRHRVFPRG